MTPELSPLTAVFHKPDFKINRFLVGLLIGISCIILSASGDAEHSSRTVVLTHELGNEEGEKESLYGIDNSKIDGRPFFLSWGDAYCSSQVLSNFAIWMNRLNDKLLQHMYLTHRLKSEETKTTIYSWIVSQEENIYIQIKKWYDAYSGFAKHIGELQQSCYNERRIYEEYKERMEETIRIQRIELESVQQELSRKVVELEEMTRQREVYYARYETAVQECSLKEALQNVHRETIDISVLFQEERHEMQEFKILIKKEILKREVEGGKYVLEMLRALLLKYNEKFEAELRKHEERVRYISVTQIAEINNELREAHIKYNDLFEKHMNLSRYYEKEKILRSDLERAIQIHELAYSKRIAELNSNMSVLFVFRDKFLKCESAFSEYTRLLEMRIHSYERLLTRGFWHVQDDFNFDLELDEEGKWLDITSQKEEDVFVDDYVLQGVCRERSMVYRFNEGQLLRSRSTMRIWADRNELKGRADVEFIWFDMDCIESVQLQRVDDARDDKRYYDVHIFNGEE